MITSDDRNYSIIAHILDYCKRIENGLSRFGNSYEDFMSDSILRDAVSMDEFQIGELSSHLSEEFKELHKAEIPWKEIRGMRNIFAHNYLDMDTKKIWEVATVDIPVLLKFCETQIQNHTSCDEAEESDED